MAAFQPPNDVNRHKVAQSFGGQRRIVQGYWLNCKCLYIGAHMTYLQGKSILITGGTGSFGKSFIKYALDNLEPRRIAVLSRDELKQYELRSQLNDDPRMRWFIGDVRDRGRLDRAFSGIATSHSLDLIRSRAPLEVQKRANWSVNQQNVCRFIENKVQS